MGPSSISVSESPAASSTTTWRRAVLPTYADFLFIALIVWVFVVGAGGWDVLLGDGDTGWHIRTGERILATGSVPVTDEFSFTKPGAEWYAWEWLSDVVYALAHRWDGLRGVALLAGALVGLFGVLLIRFMVWRSADTIVSLVVTLVAFGASSLHFLARPHLFTLVGLVGVIWLLERDRRRRTRWLWLLIPLTAVWVNLHAGFVALFPILGCLIVGSAAEAWFARRGKLGTSWWGESARYSVLALGCASASLINPYGLKLHQHIWAYLHAGWIRDAVQEFQAPSFRHESHFQFELLLVCGLLACAALLARRRFVEPLWLLMWGHLALGSVRHIPIFAIVAAPVVASEATRLWRGLVEQSPKNSIPGILNGLAGDLNPGFRRSTLWCVVFLVGLAVAGEDAGLPSTFPADRFPMAMIERNGASISSSRVFTNDEWADYLLYRYYPDQRVFFDGRSDFYGEHLLEEFKSAYLGEAGWSEVLDKYDCDLVLVPPESALSSLLRNERGWRLVDEDDRATLFGRVALLDRLTKSGDDLPGLHSETSEKLLSQANDPDLDGRKY